jgi:hypothetical protein
VEKTRRAAVKTRMVTTVEIKRMSPDENLSLIVSRLPSDRVGKERVQQQWARLTGFIKRTLLKVPSGLLTVVEHLLENYELMLTKIMKES